MVAKCSIMLYQDQNQTLSKLNLNGCTHNDLQQTNLFLFDPDKQGGTLK